MKTQKIECQSSERIETGILQIGNDWSGLFIRGDDAFILADIIAKIRYGKKLDAWEMAILTSLDAIIANLRYCENSVGGNDKNSL